MWRRMVVLALISFFGALCLPAFSAGTDIQSMMAEADALWPQRDDLEKALSVARLYEEILANDPNQVEALWKLSRTHYWIGTHSPEGKRLEIFERAVNYAEKAVALQDDCAECHYWLGVNYGVYGEAKGILKSLALVDPIEEEMKRVIELDPDFRGGAAYRLLGRVAYKLPWFAGGSKKESAAYLEKALEIGPDSFLTRVFLAETYLGLKKRDLARAQLEWVLNAPDTEDPGDREDKEKARQLYREHFE